ncbi:MAG: esterase/lipase family protein [Acidiferrobacterales bacterium]
MNNQKEVVVILPGLWLPYWAMYLLRRRIKDAGYEAHVFRYHTVIHSLEQNATRLNTFLKDIDADVIHLVSQSLGGIVIRAMFHYFPEQKPGRIVTFVPPHLGTYTGWFYSRFALGRWLLGKGIMQIVRGGIQSWTTPLREIGVIAGDKRLGLGLLAPGLPKPNDGVVAVTETMLPGIADHIVVLTGHTPSVWSKAVAVKVVTFLQAGYF